MSRGVRSHGTFAALQRLARSFGECGPASAGVGRRTRALRDDAEALGPVAIPLCLRELASTDPTRRRWAAALLTTIGRGHRDRVVGELRALVEPADGASDAAKVAALGVLADLGEAAPAPKFTDPAAVHRRSVTELADLLTTAPDVALAADLLLEQLDGDELLDFVDGMIATAPARARHLVGELLVRAELDGGLRAELHRTAAPLALLADAVEPLRDAPLGPPRLHHLRDDTGRAVLLVSRRSDGGWRCLGVFVRADGTIGDAMHRDETTLDLDAEIVAPLRADGYAPLPIGAASYAAARAIVAEAARRTVARGVLLPGAYYLGRDLLELGDEHVAPARAPDPHVTLLGRATDLLGRGDHDRARPLFERCAAERPDDADARSGLGLCLLAAGELEAAAAHLEHAAAVAPTWPTHLWNLAALRHRQGRAAACYLALRRFIGGADAAPRAARDAAHAQRAALARDLVADYERRVHLEQPGCDALRFAEVAEGLRAPPRRGKRRAAGAAGAAASARRRRSTLRRSPARP